MAEPQCCVFTRGEFFISDWQSSCVGGLSEIFCDAVPQTFRKVGNVSSCLVEVDAEILGKENKYNYSIDTSARTLINGVQMTITFNCASRENLYRALFGQKLEVDSGRRIQEFACLDIADGDFFPFDKLQAFEANLDVSLHDANGDLVSELEIGVDYKFTRSGIEIISDAIDQDDATSLRVAYDYDTADYYEFDFGKDLQGYRTIYFRGTNYDSGGESLFDAVFHKVLFAPVSGMDLITKDEFLTLTLVGSVEESEGSWFKLIKQES